MTEDASSEVMGKGNIMALTIDHKDFYSESSYFAFCHNVYFLPNVLSGLRTRHGRVHNRK